MSAAAGGGVVWGQANMRDFLEKFYTVHNPEKLSTIDLILERYKGHEGELFTHLSEKYDVAEFFASVGIDLAEEEEEEEVGGDDGGSRLVAEAASPDSSVSSLRHPNATTSTSMVQDLSSRLGLGGNPRQSMTPQSHHMQQRLAASAASADREKQHMLATIQTLKSQIASLKRDNDVVRNNLVAVVDKETGLSRELVAAGEQTKALERSRQDLKAQLRAALGQRDSKHAQLEETVLLNHRLGGQVRYLASKAFEAMESGDKDKNSCSSSGGGGGDPAARRTLHLPEFTALEKKISEAVSAASAGELKAILARVGDRRVEASDAGLPSEIDGEGAGGGGDDFEGEGEGGKDFAILQQRMLLAAQSRTIEVLQTLYLASRVEMRLSTRQNGLCEQRVAEQQMAVEGLQNKLAGIANELDTASGSADHLRRQINETTSDLASHRLMLAMAERTAQSRGSELTEAREEITSLQDALAASAAARLDLVQLCAVHTAGAEAKAAEFVRGLSERVLLEREEFISRWSGVRFLLHLPSVCACTF